MPVRRYRAGCAGRASTARQSTGCRSVWSSPTHAAQYAAKAINPRADPNSCAMSSACRPSSSARSRSPRSTQTSARAVRATPASRGKPVRRAARHASSWEAAASQRRSRWPHVPAIGSSVPRCRSRSSRARRLGSRCGGRRLAGTRLTPDALSARPTELGPAAIPRVGEDPGRCVLFGCLKQAAWISDPQGGQLPACETDVDLLFNDALARIPPDSRIRVEVWRA
jgi:hypothetical protein